MSKLMMSVTVGVFAFMQSASLFANTLTVTSLADEFPTANDVLDTSALTSGTFRWALANSSEGDTIVFADSIKGGTINMLSVKDVTPQQDTSFVIAHALTIEGNGVTINGGWDGVVGSATGTRIFLTAAGQGKTTIKNLNLVNGRGAIWTATTEKFFIGGAINASSPIRLENCQLVNSTTLDAQLYDVLNTIPNPKGGGAIFATADVELLSCYFGTNSISATTSSRGGAICQLGGTLTAEDTVFDHNYSKSYGGGAVYLASGVTGATFTDCKFFENSNGGNFDGGTIWYEMSSGALKFFGCVMRGGSNTDNGGFISCSSDADSGAELTAVDCEFSDCNGKWGGVFYARGSKSPLFVNCTFRGNAAGSFGAVMETVNGSKGYLVNCTVVGSYCYADGYQCGAFYSASGASLLNTVVAYNYYGASSANDGDGYIEGVGRICSLYKGVSTAPFGTTYTLASSLTDVASATKLFADYEMVSDRHGDTQDSRANLPATVLMPKLSGDEYDTRVVEIDPEGVLASGGYPVRVNADYSYVEYSDDGGKTWKEFFTRTGASKENLTQITADQRGVPYADGAVPIGAATVASSSGDKVLPQGVIVK